MAGRNTVATRERIFTWSREMQTGRWQRAFVSATREINRKKCYSAIGGQKRLCLTILQAWKCDQVWNPRAVSWQLKEGKPARVVLQMSSNQIISTQSKAKVSFAQLTLSSFQNACILGPIILQIELTPVFQSVKSAKNLSNFGKGRLIRL